jgi:hypothetical protein
MPQDKFAVAMYAQMKEKNAKLMTIAYTATGDSFDGYEIAMSGTDSAGKPTVSVAEVVQCVNVDVDDVIFNLVDKYAPADYEENAGSQGSITVSLTGEAMNISMTHSTNTITDEELTASYPTNGTGCPISESAVKDLLDALDSVGITKDITLRYVGYDTVDYLTNTETKEAISNKVYKNEEGVSATIKKWVEHYIDSVFSFKGEDNFNGTIAITRGSEPTIDSSHERTFVVTKENGELYNGSFSTQVLDEAIATQDKCHKKPKIA